MRILLRADSGFARDELMAWCEAHLNCLKRRAGLPVRRLVFSAAASSSFDLGGRSFARTTRRSWSRERRVVAKAEWTQGGASPRFIVTSLTRAECEASYLYEKVYCARS